MGIYIARAFIKEGKVDSRLLGADSSSKGFIRRDPLICDLSLEENAHSVSSTNEKAERGDLDVLGMGNRTRTPVFKMMQAQGKCCRSRACLYNHSRLTNDMKARHRSCSHCL